MELRYYLSTLGRRKHQILLVTVITTLFAIAATLWFVPTRYKAGLFFTLAYRDDQVTEQFKYGNYHATMATIEFGRGFSAWIKNPKLIGDIYSRAGIDAQSDQGLLGRILGPIVMKRVERVNMQVTLTSATPEGAEKLINATLDVLTQALDSYNTLSAARYKIINPSKAYETKKPELGVNIPIGIIVGLLLGILLVYLYEYFAGVVTSTPEAESLLEMEKIDLVHRSDGPPQYAFLASIVAKHRKGGVILAGVDVSPTRYTLRLARALTRSHDNVTALDADLTSRSLHTYLKGHRKMTRGLTEATTTTALGQAAYDADNGAFKVIPAGKGSQIHASMLKAFVETHRGLTLVQTQFPQHAELLTTLDDAAVVVFVQLGISCADDVRKLAALLHGREAYLVVIS